MVPSARSKDTLETRPMTGADTTMHVIDALQAKRHVRAQSEVSAKDSDG